MHLQDHENEYKHEFISIRYYCFKWCPSLSWRMRCRWIQVYVHCEAIICYENAVNSRCSRGCLKSNPNRGRREVNEVDIDQDFNSIPHVVSRGPVYLTRSDKVPTALGGGRIHVSLHVYLKKGSPNLCTYVWKHTNKQNRMAKVNSTNNKRVMNIWDIRSLANLKLEMLLVDSDVVVDTLPFLCTTNLLSSVFVILKRVLHLNISKTSPQNNLYFLQ